MVTPVYPASNNQQAIDLNISNANQFFTILQGGIDDFIPTYEGNGEIPSVAKALNEAAAYKVPLAWQTTGEETDLLQPREFQGQVYVPTKVPAAFSASPGSDWRLSLAKYVGSTVFSTIADGLAGTPANEFFFVPQSSPTEFMKLYKNNGGVEEEVASYPTMAILEQAAFDAQQVAADATATLGYRNEALTARTEAQNAAAQATQISGLETVEDAVALVGDPRYMPRDGYNMLWDAVADTYSRQGSTQGVSPIHEQMRRCLLLDDGTINYFLDPNDSNLKEDGTPSVLDGTDGQVMVRVPKFYVRVYKLFTGEWKRSISEIKLPGFVVHPAFAIGGTLQYDPEVQMWHYKGHTGEKDAFYVGAYQAAVYDDSAGANIDGLNLDDNSARIDALVDKLASVSGAYPMVGLDRSQFRTLATNRGAGWQQWDFWQYQACKLLFFVEYGGFNSQALLANGNVNVSTGLPASSADQLDSPHSVAGKSNSIGNGGGGVDSSARDTAWMSYRGIENFWGNAWQFVDGVKVNDYAWLVCNDKSLYSDAASVTDYVQLGDTAPATGGYIRDVQHNTLGDVVSDSSGGSTTAFADYYYEESGWRVFHVGGGAYYGAVSGVSCAVLNNSFAFSYRIISGRLAFSE